MAGSIGNIFECRRAIAYHVHLAVDLVQGVVAIGRFVSSGWAQLVAH
jgi:hypothetical protein